MTDWLDGLKVAVLGAGRSGIAVAKIAAQGGARVTLYDSKPKEQIGWDLNALSHLNIRLVDNFNGPFSPAKTDLLVTSPGVDSRSPLLQEPKQQGIEVIGEVEFAYRISQAPIIAITGTNGKSTTTVMTYLCLRDHGSILCGNIYGSGYEEVPLTEAAAFASPDQILVAEISSFQLEWIDRFRPKCAAITNIAPDHLNRYDSFEDYAETKRRIFKNMAKPDVYVRHPDPMTFADNPAFTVKETKLTETAICIETYEIPFDDLPFQEPHNRKNAAMAGLLAFSYLTVFDNGEDTRHKTQDISTNPQDTGQNTQDISTTSQDPRHKTQDSSPNTQHSTLNAVRNGLQNYHGLSHRMERVGERDGVRVVNNSMCTNPAALIASSSSVPQHQHLLIGGLTKDLDFSLLGDYLKATGHQAYLFGADATKINAQLGGQFPVFNTMGEAFQSAIAEAHSGEVVMLSPGCASMDQYTDFRARGDEFKNLAKEWLQHEQIATH